MNENIEEKTFKISHCPDTNEGLYSLTLELGNAHVSLSTYPYEYRKGNNVIVGLYSLTPKEIGKLAYLLKEKVWEIIRERDDKLDCGAATEEEK